MESQVTHIPSSTKIGRVYKDKSPIFASPLPENCVIDTKLSSRMALRFSSILTNIHYSAASFTQCMANLLATVTKPQGVMYGLLLHMQASLLRP